jgi:hypothetical protein
MVCNVMLPMRTDSKINKFRMWNRWHIPERKPLPVVWLDEGLI